jgi:Transposase DDE domain group 1
MPKCTDELVEFGRVGRRVVEASFDGGDIVSDGGVLLLKQVDERLGLSRAAARALGDECRSASVLHSVHSLLAQRIYGLCLGWSDVCDHIVLRHDLVMQTAVGRAEPLGSAPTLSRLETGATPAQAAALHEVLMKQFIASHAKPPKELVLDVDATHVPLHGEQERGHFHAYYDNYCYLPLYVFAGQDLLACVLRPSDRDPASVLSALIKRLLVPLRRAWPKTKIIVRADSGFCRPRVLQRLERWGVSYVIGLQKNSRLAQEVELAELALAEQYAARQTKQRMFGEFEYAAGTWDKTRRVIARLEHGPQGANPRFIVTDLPGSPKVLYERGCSRSARPSCATPAGCGCCWPAPIR